MFEIGRIFDGVDGNNMCRESKKLAVTLFDRKKTAEELYLKLRDILAVLTDDIKHTSLSFKAAEAAHSYEHPKHSEYLPVSVFRPMLQHRVLYDLLLQ